MPSPACSIDVKGPPYSPELQKFFLVLSQAFCGHHPIYLQACIPEDILLQWEGFHPTDAHVWAERFVCMRRQSCSLPIR